MDLIDKDLRRNHHDFGYRRNMWDGILLKQHLKEHHGIDSILNEFVKNNPHIFLEFLSSYSPELIAIERMWKMIRSKGTHNRYSPSIGDLIMAVTEQVALSSRLNDVLKKLCALTYLGIDNKLYCNWMTSL